MSADAPETVAASATMALRLAVRRRSAPAGRLVAQPGFGRSSSTGESFEQ